MDMVEVVDLWGWGRRVFKMWESLNGNKQSIDLPVNRLHLELWRSILWKWPLRVNWHKPRWRCQNARACFPICCRWYCTLHDWEPHRRVTQHHGCFCQHTVSGCRRIFGKSDIDRDRSVWLCFIWYEIEWTNKRARSDRAWISARPRDGHEKRRRMKTKTKVFRMCGCGCVCA